MGSLSTEIYRPSAVVGKFYARVRGANMPFAEVGNWTQAELDIKTKEDKLPDMTVLGGGTHSKIERVEGITLKVKTADLNLNTLARHLRGVIEVKAAGTVTDQAITLYPGGLIPLPHIGVTALTLKGATDTVIAAAGNYEVRPEGIYVLPGSTAITAEIAGKVSYSYGEQATIEALASAAVELELRFGGMNEALSGTPEVLDIFRAEAGLAKKLAVLSSKLDELEFDCEILSDTTRTGVGKSRFFAKHMAAVAAA